MDHMDNEATQGLQLRGQFTRRQLVGAGLAIPAIGVVMAACGDDKADTTTTEAAVGGETTVAGDTTVAPDSTGAAPAGGTIRVATQRPAASRQKLRTEALRAPTTRHTAP